MTTALVKDHPWSLERARSQLVERAVAARATIAGRRVEVLPEPLLQRGDSGRLFQAIRVVLEGAAEVREVRVGVAGAATWPVEVLPGPDGSVRALLPAVEEPTNVVIELPQLDDAGQLTFVQQPVREWSIHLVQHSHYDIGYTDPQGTVLRQQLAYLDACLDLARSTQNRPEEARFRWSVEALYPFAEWLRTRPPPLVNEFLHYVRKGQLELTALPYNVHLDTCSTDELYELLRLAHDIRKQYDVDIAVAMQTDVPGQPAGLPAALSQEGVRYLSVAHNWAGRSVPHLIGGQHVPRLFRWRSPSGENVLVWMTDTPHGLAYMEGASLGFTTSYDMVEELLPAYLTAMSTRSYPYGPGAFGWHGPAVTDREPYAGDLLHLRVLGRHSDNAPPSLIHSDIVRRWNETWAFPQLRLSTNAEFFHAAEERMGDDIPVLTGDWGDWWVEGVGSAARPQAMVRQAQARVTDATTLSSLGRQLGEHGVPAERSDARRTYRAISMFNEHTWGAADPWTIADHGRNSGEEQWHWKYARAVEARDEAEALFDSAVAHLGVGLSQAADALATYYAVNTAGFGRSGIVSLFVRESMVPIEGELEVRDGRTGEILPSEERAQDSPESHAGGRYLRVHVRDVPAAGGLRLTVHPARLATAGELGTGQSLDEPAVLENAHLRVHVDLRRSCIQSIVDKASGRELVDQYAVIGMNGYIYDTYTTAGGYNHQSNKTTVSDELELLGSRTLARPAVLLELTNSAVEQRLVYEFPADGVDWVRVTLRLPEDSAHLEIENRLSKPSTMTKESAYFAFPFDLDDPQTRFEITGGMTGSGMPEVPGAPVHMRAVRDWVGFEDESAAVAWVTVDAPLVQPEVIVMPYAPFPESLSPRKPGTVFSWVHNNVWDTNFPVQQAFETSFRYAIGVRRAEERISAAALSIRTATAVTHPLAGVLATAPGDSDAIDEACWSVLDVDDARVRLIAVTESDEPRGHLVKLQSYAEEPVAVRVRPHFDVRKVMTATFLGEPRDEVTSDDAGVMLHLQPLEAVALLLMT